MVQENGTKTAAAKSPKERKKAGVPWTAEEHKRFLLGLSALGKGDWRGISRHYVQTRTPTQVASHAQKYFIRQTNTGNKRKRRTSLFDTTLESIPEANGGAAAAALASANGSADASGLTALALNGRAGDAQQASVSPSNSAEQLCLQGQAVTSLGMPMGIMPVGILASQAGAAAAAAANGGTNGAVANGASNGAMNGAAAATMAALGARDFAAFPAMAGGAGGMPMLGGLGGVLPQFAACMDPGNLALLSMMFSMQQQGAGAAAAMAAAASASGAQAQGQSPTGGARPTLAAHVFRPMAVRYSNKEVLEFKKEWNNGSFTRKDSDPGAKEENKLRKHIRKVYKQTSNGVKVEPEQKQVLPSQDLTSVSNLSANTLI
eukprot:CAMPEP_0197490524 /NCGR_PEP_ID=MMETSP1311-20131121/5053_1 /TAXON_ID=464262 /ORGANISM="Genus nov. species nov., Strain RCC856" /LENGTH=375 /DNA_ID=CAMNT_0043035059 /DNA_START=269 /DNA_END=1396 /DNA_ORIENTATION=+